MAATQTVHPSGNRTGWVPRLWVAGALAGALYGGYLIIAATRVPAGAALTGQFGAQPVAKTVMALLLAAAAWCHPITRERRWLLGALLCSAVGDLLLAMPWWEPSFVGGLGGFLLAHLCYLGALLPLAVLTPVRGAVAAVVAIACVVLLVWFWPHLAQQGLTVPVTVYIVVLGAMVVAAVLADLPTRWTAVGAVCFAVSDAMIGISEFIRGDQLLAVPIWWAYALSQVLITAGFFFGRRASAGPATPVR